MSRGQFIDRYFGKAISKTFLVFIIGTVALFSHNISGTEWIIISTAYIGITKYSETVIELFKQKTNNNQTIDNPDTL